MNYLVHIGYPKAASTFLQKTLFSGTHDEMKPLGHQKVEIHKPGKNLFYDYYTNPENEPVRTIAPFMFDAEKTREEIRRQTYEQCKVNCLSNEAWAGHPFSGGVRAKEYAERIHTVLPQAKILIVIRRQENMLVSAYADSLERSYKTASLKDFLFLPKQDMFPSPTPFYFCFDGLVSHYIELFGADNVLALPFEIIKQKGEEAFINEICRFSGVGDFSMGETRPDKNIRNYDMYPVYKKIRLLNMLTCKHPSLDRPGIRIRGLRRAVAILFSLFTDKQRDFKSEDIEKAHEFLEEYIRESNVQLQKVVNYDLKELGYSF